MIDPEKLIYILFTGMIIFLAFILVSSFKGIYSIIAMIFILITAIFVFSIGLADSIVFPILMSVLGITFQIAKDYKISRSQKEILKNVNGLNYATGYVTANLFPYTFKLESPPGEEESKFIQAPVNWERAVSILNFPWKYHIISSGMDVQETREEFEGQRSFQEFQMSRAMQSTTPNEMAVEQLQRRINMIQTKMDRISQGERPIATLMYIEVTAVGVSEKAAVDNLNAQIASISTAFSSFDVQLNRISGRELYVLFQTNFSLPTTFEEVAADFDQQS